MSESVDLLNSDEIAEIDNPGLQAEVIQFDVTGIILIRDKNNKVISTRNTKFSVMQTDFELQLSTVEKQIIEQFHEKFSSNVNLEVEK